MYDQRLLWEILVPVYRPYTGQDYELHPYSEFHHHSWDDKVRTIAGGLTILHQVKGKWTSTDGKLHEESVIPVRIACTREQISKIAIFTKEHYKQESILYYLLSNEVYMV